MKRRGTRYASRPRQQGAEPEKNIYESTVDSKNNGKRLIIL